MVVFGAHPHSAGARTGPNVPTEHVIPGRAPRGLAPSGLAVADSWARALGTRSSRARGWRSRASRARARGWRSRASRVRTLGAGWSRTPGLAPLGLARRGLRADAPTRPT